MAASKESTRCFEKGTDTIYWGDAVAVLEKQIPDGSVHLIFVDPPYNIGKRFDGFHDRWPSEEEYVKWCHAWLDLCIQKLRPDGSMYVMSSTQAMPHLDLYLRSRMTIQSRIIWHYDSSGVQAKRFFGSLYEPILFCVRDPKNFTFNADVIRIEARTGATRKLIDYRKPVPAQYNTSKVPGNVWYFPRVRYRMSEYEEHPSQKPEALLDRIVKVSSNEGDTVLDPFAGTFTTAAVAQHLARRTISIEAARAYIPIGLRRLGISDTFEGKRLAAPLKSYQKPQLVSEPSLFEPA